MPYREWCELALQNPIRREVQPDGRRCNMKFNYYPETDSLYIDLSAKTSVDSQEVAPGVVVDFDEKGNIVGIDIDHASLVVDLSRLETNALPLADLHIAGAKASLLVK